MPRRPEDLRKQSTAGEQGFSAVREQNVFKPLPFKGAIFDLDGVVTSTANVHESAWRMLFEGDLGLPFSHEDYLAHVDGKPRIAGVQDFLSSQRRDVAIEEADNLGNKKQGYFLGLLKTGEIPVFDTTVELIQSLRVRGVKTAIASSSLNTPFILERTNLSDLFDVVVGGTVITVHGQEKQKAMKGKPAPDIFLTACEELGLLPDEIIAFEDATSGIEAIKAAGMIAVAISRGDNHELEKTNPDAIVEDLVEVTPDMLGELFQQRRIT